MAASSVSSSSRSMVAPVCSATQLHTVSQAAADAGAFATQAWTQESWMFLSVSGGIGSARAIPTLSVSVAAAATSGSRDHALCFVMSVPIPVSCKFVTPAIDRQSVSVLLAAVADGEELFLEVGRDRLTGGVGVGHGRVFVARQRRLLLRDDA